TSYEKSRSNASSRRPASFLKRPKAMSSLLYQRDEPRTAGVTSGLRLRPGLRLMRRPGAEGAVAGDHDTALDRDRGGPLVDVGAGVVRRAAVEDGRAGVAVDADQLVVVHEPDHGLVQAVDAGRHRRSGKPERGVGGRHAPGDPRLQ